ncbi:MAG: TGS domain-containing protein [bacterium]
MVHPAEDPLVRAGTWATSSTSWRSASRWTRRRSATKALGLVHSIWRPVPGRFKDCVALRGGGYQSLHTAVMGPEGERVEIEIRALRMHPHRRARRGGALVVQGGASTAWAQDTDERFRWLRQLLLEWQRDLKDPNEFMETVKVDLFDDEVFVFTPHQRVEFFPVGSTPLDFAYRIHTTLGHECTGAIINGTIQPLKYVLQNGDVVEILRTTGSKPKPDWIKIVRTGRAATKIRHFLRQEANARAEQIGLELLERELRRYGVGLTRLRRAGKLDEVAGQLRQRSGEGRLLMDLGLRQIRQPGAAAHRPARSSAPGRNPRRKRTPPAPRQVIPTKGGSSSTASMASPPTSPSAARR